MRSKEGEQSEASRMTAATMQSDRLSEEVRNVGTTARLFSLMLSLEGQWPEKVVMLAVVVDYLQVLALILNTHFFSENSTLLAQVVYWSHLPVFDRQFADITYMEYSAFLWTFAVFFFATAAYGIILAGQMNEKKNLIKPLKVIVPFVTTCLYVPIVHCLCALVICDGDGRMWMFRDVGCWSSSHIPLFIVGVVMMVAYLPVVYILRCSVYECECMSHYFLAKAHANVEAIEFCFTTASVFLFHILVGRGERLAYSIFICAGGAVLAGIYAFVLPFYSKRANSVKVSSFLSLSFVAFVYAVTESKPLVTGVVVLTLLPVVAMVGYLFGIVRIDKRMMAVLAEVEQRGVIPDTSGIPGFGTFPGLPNYEVNSQFPLLDMNRVEASQQSSRITEFKVPYISRVYIDTDVELATRGCLEVYSRTGQEPHSDYVSYLASMYSRGLAKFRNSVVLKLQAIWFLLIVAQRAHFAYSYFEGNEDVARVFAVRSTLQDRYNSYKIINLLRKKLNIKDRYYEAFSRKAMDLHVEVLEQMYQFWQRLMELSVDMVEVGSLASSIAENREKGMGLFKKALVGDARILGVFVEYLDGVMFNREAALLCKEEIDELDGEKRSRQMGGSRKTAAGNDNNYLKIVDNITSQKDIFGTSSSTTVKKLSVNMNIVFFLLLMLVVGNLIHEVHHVQVQLTVIDKMDASGQVRMLAAKAAYEIYDLFYDIETEIKEKGTSGVSPEKIQQQRDKMEATGTAFSRAHNQLTYGGQSTSYRPHVRYYEEPVNEVIKSDGPALVSLWEVGNMLTDALHTIQLNLTTTNLQQAATEAQYDGSVASLEAVMQSLMHDNSVQFMLINAPSHVPVAFNRSMTYYEEESAYLLNQATVTLVCIFVVSFCVNLAIYFLFLWHFKKITVSKLIILQLFTLIPYETLARLSADAKERVLAVRGLSKQRAKKNESGLPMEIVIEIDKALDGRLDEIDDPTPITELERHLANRRRFKDKALASKLRQYIRLLKSQVRDLDQDTVDFVRKAILGASVPASCIRHRDREKEKEKEKEREREKERKKDEDKDKKKEDDKQNGQPVRNTVGFKGKTIYDRSQHGAGDDNTSAKDDGEDEKESGLAQTVVPDMNMTMTSSSSSKGKQANVPAVFWVQNLALVMLIGACFGLTLSAYLEAADIRDAHEDRIKLIQASQAMRSSFDTNVQNARKFVQFGDARYYTRVTEYYNQQVWHERFNDLVDHGASSTETEKLFKARSAVDFVDRSIRSAMKMAVIAFDKPHDLVPEARDTTWGTAENTLMKSHDYDVLAKYRNIKPSNLEVLSSQDVQHADTATLKKSARAMLYNAVFEENLQQYSATLDSLLPEVDYLDTIANTITAMIISSSCALVVTAVVCWSLIRTVRTSPPLAPYKKAGVGYGIMSVLVFIVAVCLIFELAHLDDAKAAVEASEKFVHESAAYVTKSERPIELARQYVQFGEFPAAYDWKYNSEEEAPVDLEMIRERILIPLGHIEREREVRRLWMRLRWYEKVAGALLLKPRTDPEYIHTLRDFVLNTTWSEADFEATRDLEPLDVLVRGCTERERGCVESLLTNETYDMARPQAEREQLARETLFAPPYSHIEHTFRELLRDSMAQRNAMVLQDATDNTVQLTDQALVFLVLGCTVYVLVIVGVSGVVGFILIQLASGQNTKNQLDSPLLRDLLVKCRLSLCLIMILIAVIFAFEMQAVVSTGDRAEDLNRASAREWIVARTMVCANELDLSSSERQGVVREILGEMVDEYNRQRDALYFGGQDSSRYNEVRSTQDQSVLTFGESDIDAADETLAVYYSDACGNTPGNGQPVLPDVSVAPMDVALNTWTNEVREFLKIDCSAQDSASGAGDCPPRGESLGRLRDQVGGLIEKLEESGRLYESRATDSVKQTSLFSRLILGVTLATIILLYIFVFRKMLSKLAREENGTKGVLKMIPQQVIESVSAISEYLETGKVDNTEQLAKNFAQSEKLLANILPENISRRLKSGESPIADTHASITILFTDFVGFTSISSNLSAVEIVSFLNEVFIEYDLIADLMGLEKIKTIGDAYFMAGGLKPSITDHAVRVVEASTQMFQALNEHNQRHPDRKELQMRLGCHTGPAVAGCIGVKKVAYDLWGESVGMAEKMESGGVPGRIHISPSTHEMVRMFYLTEERHCPKVSFKTYLIAGRKQPTPYMHLVRGSCKPQLTPEEQECNALMA
eukprot:TRINITY_DN2841_c2_g1_i1.p1 TRINITY_DN2841_c2_g1~~TRINITY_DN2841_c2_g1_i1.p1  ORF type:complete len:2211 (+),score=876.08 TRINITY_DN2841_c2_g1_i1:80-6712(+)